MTRRVKITDEQFSLFRHQKMEIDAADLSYDAVVMSVIKAKAKLRNEFWAAAERLANPNPEEKIDVFDWVNHEIVVVLRTTEDTKEVL